MQDGAPAELVFTTGDPALRLTLDVAGPETELQDRLGLVCSCLPHLTAPEADPAWMEAMRTMQARGRLLWGAWLGLRMRAGAVGGKIYAEVPAEVAEDSAYQAAGPIFPGSELRMIGHEPALGRIEHYYFLSGSGRRDVQCLLAAHMSAGLANSYERALRNVLGLPLDTALRWLTMGYSITRDNRGGSACALFFRARGVRDGTDRITQEFLRRDCGISPLAAFLARTDGVPDPAMVTLAADAQGAVQLRIGYSAMQALQLDRFSQAPLVGAAGGGAEASFCMRSQVTAPTTPSTGRPNAA